MCCLCLKLFLAAVESPLNQVSGVCSHKGPCALNRSIHSTKGMWNLAPGGGRLAKEQLFSLLGLPVATGLWGVPWVHPPTLPTRTASVPPESAAGAAHSETQEVLVTPQCPPSCWPWHSPLPPGSTYCPGRSPRKPEPASGQPWGRGPKLSQAQPP